MNLQKQAVQDIIARILSNYDSVVKQVDDDATAQTRRAYGGVVRAQKGKLVEDTAKDLLNAAWLACGGDIAHISFNDHPKYNIFIRKEYVDNIKDEELRNEISAHMEQYKVRHGADIHVSINGEFLLSVECKAYTENAMMKRILFDAYLLKTKFPNLRFALIQFESQLGGDYSELERRPVGSGSTRTLMSYMDSVDLHIITLLKGERKVDRPIHNPKFYKPMEKEAIEKAILTLCELLPNMEK